MTVRREAGTKVILPHASCHLIRDQKLQDSFLGYGIERGGEIHGDET